MFSFVMLVGILVLSILAPLISNSRPYVMRYQGRLYFPIFHEPSPKTLGLEDVFTIDYKTLDFNQNQDWAIWPLIKYDPYGSNLKVEKFPSPPTWENPMGTDDRGRDVFTRLLYGFRFSFIYAMGAWTITYFIGVLAGLAMGFWGGKIDFLGQRTVEIMSSMPQFFLLIILISIFSPSLWLLIGITSLFGWIPISYYLRGEALKLRKLEFVEAARALGMSSWKILIKHVLPNALTPIITFSPFAIAAGITELTALDYLGFGLAPPTPSWGELLNEAKKYITTAWWLAFFPSLALFTTLTLLNFIGEGLRNAFDPKRS